MAKRFSFLVPYKDLAKNLQSISPTAAIANKFTFSSATQGDSDPLAKEGAESEEEAAKETVEIAWDAAKKTAQFVTETTTAEADMNVVDTAEYRSTEDLNGELGDGCDKIEL